MHNQHAGLSRVLATQHITRLRQRASWPVDRSEAAMSKLTRALIVGATLVAMNLAGLAAIAQPSDETTAQPQVTENWNYYNQATRVPPAELKARMQADAAQRAQSDRAAYYNQATRMSPAELKAWTQANDGAGTPPAPPAPARPAAPTGQPGWLVVSLGVLAAAMAVVAGLAVLAARRATRTARPRQAI
jgi:hypothetical protein